MLLTRRQVLRRRRIAVFGAAAVVLSTVFYLPLTLLAPIGSVAASEKPITLAAQPAATLDWPALGASAVGAVGYPEILGTGGNAASVPIASISKVVTALVVLEAKPLAFGDSGPDITFTARDVAIKDSYRAVNGKVEAVTAGLVLTQHQVMEVMLVESANNYTDSLANWAFGSVEDFLPVANEWLAKNGLASTRLSDATGMSPANVSTASDLVRLGKLALANPVVAAIVGTPAGALPVVGAIKNSNALLGIDGIRGIKTGTLDEAGACLLFAADYLIGGETVTIVGAVLGGTDHRSLNAQVRELLGDARASFHEITLTTAGESFGTYTTAWGETVEIVAAEDANVVVWSDAVVEVDVSTEEIGLGAKGDDIGIASFAVGAETFTVPLELAATIEDPGPWWRLANPAALF